MKCTNAANCPNIPKRSSGIFGAVVCAAVMVGTLYSVREIVKPDTGVYYPMTAVVVNSDMVTNTVIVRNSLGHEFQFYGAAYWNAGDVATMLMDDNGTETVTDDTIVRTSYSGFSTTQWR